MIKILVSNWLFKGKNYFKYFILLTMLSILKIIIHFCVYNVFCLFGSYGNIVLPKDVSIPAVLTFGDSFVDTGNNNYIKALGKANFPPYGKDFVDGIPTGRFSNGKSIADFFAQKLGVKEYLPAYLDPSLQDEDILTGVSFASGGTGYDPLTPKITSAIPFSIQLDMFKQYVNKLKKIVGEEGANNIINNSVVIIEAGTNDLLINYFTVPIRRLEYDVPAYANLLVNSALTFVQEIHELGCKRIVVVNAPPVGCFPVARTFTGGLLRKCQDKENKAVRLFNSILRQQLESLATSFPESKVVSVDFYKPMINIIENPHQYGLEVVDKGCCGTGELEVTFLCNKLTPTCNNDSKYLFWDSIHTSEEGSKIIVDQILQDLVKSLF